MLAQGMVPSLIAQGPRPIIGGVRPVPPMNMHHPMFRSRPPIVYNQPHRPRLNLNVPAVHPRTTTTTNVSPAEVVEAISSSSSSNAVTTTVEVTSSAKQIGNADTESGN